MPLAQDEPVPLWPAGVQRLMPEHAEIEGGNNLYGGQGAAGSLFATTFISSSESDEKTSAFVLSAEVTDELLGSDNCGNTPRESGLLYYGRQR